MNHTDPTADPCTAHIVNEHSDGTHHCTREAGHTGGEWGEDHTGPADDEGGRYYWSDSAIGAVPHQPAAVSAVVSPPTTPPADPLRGQVLDALDAPYCQTLGYLTPDDLLDAYDASRAAVVAAPTSRAAVLLWAADRFERDRYVQQMFGHQVATELRRLAAEAQQQPDTEASRAYCKCASCWGWFVEDHPGEDLDELGKDLRWWSGLPEHRDPPAPAEEQPAAADDEEA